MAHSDRYALNEAEKAKALETQIHRLKTLGAIYDSGDVETAKLIAVVIANLVYDSRHTKSLLSQLGRKSNMGFWSTAHGIDDQFNIMPISRLISIEISEDEEACFGPVFSNLNGEIISFEEWWSDNIFRTRSGEFISRGQLILTSRDQDGLAHSDEAIEGKYAELTRLNGLGVSNRVQAETLPLAAPEVAALRQIAHELLVSLDPSEHRRDDLGPKHCIQAVFSGRELRAIAERGHQHGIFARDFPDMIDDHQYFHSLWISGDMPRRNGPCPCGSGARFKHCHGKLDSLPGAVG